MALKLDIKIRFAKKKYLSMFFSLLQMFYCVQESISQRKEEVEEEVSLST